MWNYQHPDEQLYHHGIKGMKWGVRRYQKKNGALTAAGKKRYSEKAARLAKMHSKEASDYESIIKDIKGGQYGRYGYKSQKQANADIRNWERLAIDERKVAKRWLETHDKLMTSPMDKNEARAMMKSGKKYTMDVLIKGINHVANHPVTDEDA